MSKIKPYKHTFRIPTGTTVQCRVTAARGVVTCASVHMNGCDRYFLQPKMSGDRKMPEGYWIDDHDLMIDKEVPVIGAKTSQNPKAETGGMMSKTK